MGAYNLVQSILTACAAGFSLLCGFLLGGIGIYQLFVSTTGDIADYPLYAFGLILLTIGFLLVPFTVAKFKSLRTTSQNTPGTDPGSVKSATKILVASLILWVILLVGGYFLAGKGLAAALTMPVFAILGILLPITIFITILWRKVGVLETSRSWGALSTGMTLSPLVGTILEFGILFLILAFMMVILMQDSSLLGRLEITASRLANGQNQPEIINNILASFLSSPMNRFIVYSVIAGLIPIIEEIVKQIPFWLLAWRKLTPRDGLLVGALGGAGFALTESLLTVTALGGTEEWLYQILGRAGAGLMHIVTGAIGGWGLASAIQGKSYARACLAYLASIVFHGLWNAMATWGGIAHLTSDSLPGFSVRFVSRRGCRYALAGQRAGS